MTGPTAPTRSVVGGLMQKKKKRLFIALVVYVAAASVVKGIRSLP